MYVTVFNTGSSAVTVDDEGRQVHSGDWGTVDEAQDRAAAAISSRVLVVQDDPGDGVDINPRAREAHDRTAEANANAESRPRGRKSQEG